MFFFIFSFSFRIRQINLWFGCSTGVSHISSSISIAIGPNLIWNGIYYLLIYYHFGIILIKSPTHYFSSRVTRVRGMAGTRTGARTGERKGWKIRNFPSLFFHIFSNKIFRPKRAHSLSFFDFNMNIFPASPAGKRPQMLWTEGGKKGG